MEQSNKRCYHAGVRPPEADIREAVHLYEQEGWTLLELGKKFHRSKSSIHRWINIFAKDLNNGSMNEMKRRERHSEKAKRKYGVKAPEQHLEADTEESSVMGKDQPRQEDLLARIAQLENELRDARLMRDFYDEMINIAEQDFKIPIRKKGGAKQ